MTLFDAHREQSRFDRDLEVQKMEDEVKENRTSYFSVLFWGTFSLYTHKATSTVFCMAQFSPQIYVGFL